MAIVLAASAGTVTGSSVNLLTLPGDLVIAAGFSFNSAFSTTGLSSSTGVPHALSGDANFDSQGTKSIGGVCVVPPGGGGDLTVTTNGTGVTMNVYRSNIGGTLSLGNQALQGGYSTEHLFPAIPMQPPSGGSSWAAALAAHGSITAATQTDLRAAPSGLTFRQTRRGNIGLCATYDSAGPVTSRPAATRTMSVRQGWNIWVAEIRETPGAAAVDTVYKGAQTRAARYIGASTDAQRYVGAKRWFPA